MHALTVKQHLCHGILTANQLDFAGIKVFRVVATGDSEIEKCKKRGGAPCKMQGDFTAGFVKHGMRYYELP